MDAMEHHESMHKVLEQLQQMETRLADKIEGHCDGLERRFEDMCSHFHDHFTVCCDELQNSVDVTTSRSKEHLIVLEMMKTEVEQWKPEVEKRMTDMTLEIMRVNKFMESEHHTTASGPGIFG